MRTHKILVGAPGEMGEAVGGAGDEARRSLSRGETGEGFGDLLRNTSQE